MNIVFFLSGLVAIVATVLVITRTNAVHALLYLILSLLAVAIVFYSLGAAFAAALEVITYAGAIMVLFLFVVMLLNIGPPAAEQERKWLSPGIWIGPSILAVILLAELAYVFVGGGAQPAGTQMIDPKQVSISLFGPYLLGVELASILLTAGLIGAYHLGQREDAPGKVAGGME